VANTGLAKVAVQCSAETFVVNQSLVLRINICGENRHLRQARKRFNSMILFVFNTPVNHLLLNNRMYTSACFEINETLIPHS
jgi:hypothetical protein